jgi:large conductance mechanosensitive channel
MLKEFRSFVLRGNVVDLAVAVVIGAAFGNVVNAVVRDVITPLVAAAGGKHDFSNLAFTVNGSRFAYGDLINAVVSFLIVAATVFFLVVKPINALAARRGTEPDVDSETRPCPRCLSRIPAAATRCAFCTTDLPPATTPA